MGVCQFAVAFEPDLSGPACGFHAVPALQPVQRLAEAIIVIALNPFIWTVLFSSRI